MSATSTRSGAAPARTGAGCGSSTGITMRTRWSERTTWSLQTGRASGLFGPGASTGPIVVQRGSGAASDSMCPPARSRGVGSPSAGGSPARTPPACSRPSAGQRPTRWTQQDPPSIPVPAGHGCRSLITALDVGGTVGRLEVRHWRVVRAKFSMPVAGRMVTSR